MEGGQTASYPLPLGFLHARYGLDGWLPAVYVSTHPGARRYASFDIFCFLLRTFCHSNERKTNRINPLTICGT